MAEPIKNEDVGGFHTASIDFDRLELPEIAPSIDRPGLIEHTWDNFPFLQVFSQLGAGVTRSLENIIELPLQFFGGDNLRSERDISEFVHAPSNLWARGNQAWTESNQENTDVIDRELAGQDLGQKLLNPYWYTKHAAQTTARVGPELLSLYFLRRPVSVSTSLGKVSLKKQALLGAGKKQALLGAGTSKELIKLGGSTELAQTGKGLAQISQASIGGQVNNQLLLEAGSKELIKLSGSRELARIGSTELAKLSTTARRQLLLEAGVNKELIKLSGNKELIKLGGTKELAAVGGKKLAGVGGKKSVKGSLAALAKGYFFDSRAIATRVFVNSAIDAEQTAEELVQIGLDRGMTQAEAEAWANKGFKSAMPMNLLIYGVSDTASRRLVAPQILRGLSAFNKGKIVKGTMKATGGLAKNWAIETFLEELPQSRITEFSMDFADGNSVNLLDVYGWDTYKDAFTNPEKQEIMAATAFMSPLLSIADVVSSFKDNPSKTKAPDGTDGTHPGIPMEQVMDDMDGMDGTHPNIPMEKVMDDIPVGWAFREFIPTEQQLLEIGSSRELTVAYAKRQTMAHIDMGKFTEQEIDSLLTHIADITDPASMLLDYNKARQAIIESGNANPEAIANLDKKIAEAFEASIDRLAPNISQQNRDYFEEHYNTLVENRLQEIEANNLAAKETLSDIEQRIPDKPQAQPVAKTQRVKAEARKRIDQAKAHFNDLFPSYKVEEQPGALKVTLPNGKIFNVAMIEDAESKYDYEGAWINEENIMELSGLSESSTVAHESFHMAEKLIFNQKDINFLDAKFGKGVPAMERRAKAFEKHMAGKKLGPVSRIFDKIKNFFATLADKMGIRTQRGIFEKAVAGKQKPGVKKQVPLPKKLFSRKKRPAKKKETAKEREARVVNEIKNAQTDEDMVDIYKKYLVKVLSLSERGRSKLLQQFKIIITAKKIGTKKKRLAKALELVQQVREKAAINELQEKIEKLLKRNKPKRVGVKRKGRVDVDTHEILDQVRKIVAGENYEENVTKLEKLTAIKDLTDSKKPRELTDAEQLDFEMLSNFLDYEKKGEAELDHALKWLTDLAENGRTKRLAKDAEKRAEKEFIVDRLLKTITGRFDKRGLTQEQILERERKLKGIEKMLDRVAEMGRDLQTFMGSWEHIMELVSRLDQSAEMFGSNLSEWAVPLVHNARRALNQGVQDYDDGKKAAQMKAYGIDPGSNFAERFKAVYKLNKKLEKESERIEDPRISLRVPIRDSEQKITGYTNKKITELTIPEAQYYWMMLQNPKNIDLMGDHGFDEQTARELIGFMGGSNSAALEMAQWHIQYFQNDWKAIDKVHVKLQDVHAPKQDYYTGIYYAEDYSVDPDAIGPSPDGIPLRKSTTVFASSLISRVTHNQPPKRVSMDAMARDYVSQMEHYKAFAEPVQQLKSVFFDTDIKKAIINNHGQKSYNQILEFIDVFTNGGGNLSLKMGFLNGLLRNFTSAVLTFKPGQVTKQYASFPAIFNDVPVAFVMQSLTDPIGIINLVKDKKFIKERLTRSNQIELERDLEAGKYKSYIGAWRMFKQAGFLPIKYGDIGPVILGGGIVYKYNYDKARKKHGHKKADEIATLKFERAMERMQQASNPKDLMIAQIKGGTMMALTTTFMSTQIAYSREYMAAVNALVSGRDQKRAVKTLINAHLVLPFTWTVASFIVQEIFKGLFGGEDEDEEWWERFGKQFMVNAASGPFAGVPIFAQLSGMMINQLILGHNYNRDSQISPFISSFDDLSIVAGKVSNDKDLTTKDWERLFKFGSKMSGIPVQAGDYIFKAIEE